MTSSSLSSIRHSKDVLHKPNKLLLLFSIDSLWMSFLILFLSFPYSVMWVSNYRVLCFSGIGISYNQIWRVMETFPYESMPFDSLFHRFDLLDACVLNGWIWTWMDALPWWLLLVKLRQNEYENGIRRLCFVHSGLCVLHLLSPVLTSSSSVYVMMWYD